MTDRLREGRGELHDRLNAAAYEGKLWPRRELEELLSEARDEVVRCPHAECAYCYQLDKETR